MRPIFTLHAGEVLAAEYIERHFKKLKVWIPSKDSGEDLLVTHARHTKAVSVQVKFSKDFLPSFTDAHLVKGLRCLGWFTLSADKIRKSNADIWLFGVYDFDSGRTEFIILTPKELLRTLQRIHGKSKWYQTYFWFTEQGRCWETRGLKKNDQALIAANSYSNPRRDLTKHLNNWRRITSKL